jgi:hypothetical protein
MNFKPKRNILLMCGSLIILFGVFIFNLTLIITFQESKEYKIPGYIISIIFQLCLCTFSLKFLIKESVNKNNKNRKGLSLLTNIIFFTSSIMFVFNKTYLKELIFQIFNIIVLLIMLSILNKTIKIEKGDDVSLLKSINFIIVSIFIGITYILGNHSENSNFISFINIYYILPLLLLQGLYEALDGRSKYYQKGVQ